MAARFSATNRTRWPRADKRGDQVGDRLRLAGARRPVDDQVGPGHRAVDRRTTGWRRRPGRGTRPPAGRVSGSADVTFGCRARTASRACSSPAMAQISSEPASSVGRGLQIEHHGQLGVGEVPQHDRRCPTANPGTAEQALASRSKSGAGPGGPASWSRSSSSSARSRSDLEVGLEQVQQRRVDLPLPGRLTSKSSPATAAGRQRRLAEQDRRPAGTAVRGLLQVAMPHARNKVCRPRSSKFSVALALTVRARRAAPPTAVSLNSIDSRTGREDRSWSTATGLAPDARTDVESALLEVPVIQQGVPATQVDELTRPDTHRPAHQANPARTCRQ